MKILEIKLKDFKKHADLEIKRPTGDSIFLIGDNDAGKTSVIQAVYGCLKAISLPESVIREGTDESKIVLVIGDEKQEYTVSMRITEDGDTLTLRSKEGATYSKPVAKLQELVGGLIYNIFELAQMKPEDQLQWVKQYFRIDVAQLQQEYKTNYDDRRDLNRELKRIDAELENSGYTIAQVTASKEIDITELNAQIQDGNNVNNAINLLQQGIQNKKNTLSLHSKRYHEIEETIKKLKQERDDLDKTGQQLNGQITEDEALLSKQVFVNISELQEQMRTANEKNRVHARLVEVGKLAARSKQLHGDSAGKTARLQQIKGAIQGVIAASKLPKGFELFLKDEDDTREGLYLNGLPFSELSQSTSDIMKSTIDLQDAINPDGLKVACIHRFESLGTKKRAEIGAFIQKHKIQAIIEVMQPGGQELIIKEKL